MAGKSQSPSPRVASRPPPASQGRSEDPQEVLGNAAIQDLLAANAAPDDSDALREHASDAGGGGGGDLPFLDRIQESFGPYDVSEVAAHTDAAAAEACEEVGAEAFATGGDVALGSASDLHTVAHEAAHVVQQRAGLHLDGGMGEEGDVYERNADAVADRVVAGRSAVDLLAGVAPGGESAAADPGTDAPLQRKVTVDGKEQSDLDAAWKEVSTRDPVATLEPKEKDEARKVLGRWIGAPAKSSNPLATSENREYDRWTHLARALRGEVKSKNNLDRETELAKLAYTSNAGVETGLARFIKRLQAWHAQHQNLQQEASKTKGRYSFYYSSYWSTLVSGGRTLQEAIDAPPSDLNGMVTLAADYALALRKKGDWEGHVPDDLSKARKNHWNTDEGADWTKQARKKHVPLSAGPSATTGQLLALAEKINAPVPERTALAWGIFAFFNKSLNLHQSGTHRYHEVMSVAEAYGVPYKEWRYPRSTGLEGEVA